MRPISTAADPARSLQMRTMVRICHAWAGDHRAAGRSLQMERFEITGLRANTSHATLLPCWAVPWDRSESDGALGNQAAGKYDTCVAFESQLGGKYVPWDAFEITGLRANTSHVTLLKGQSSGRELLADLLPLGKRPC